MSHATIQSALVPSIQISLHKYLIWLERFLWPVPVRAMAIFMFRPRAPALISWINAFEGSFMFLQIGLFH